MPVREDIWLHLFFGGYAFGSIALTAMADKAGIFAPPVENRPAEPHIEIAPPPTPRPEPFRFARWEDDEERPS